MATGNPIRSNECVVSPWCGIELNNDRQRESVEANAARAVMQSEWRMPLTDLQP